MTALILVLIFSGNIQAQEVTKSYSSDYNFKWGKYKSNEFAFKCKLPLEYEINITEDIFGKEMQLSSEHDFLSFFVYARNHSNDLTKEDPEDLAINATYNFLNAMQGELVYMRNTENSGVSGYEARMNLDNDMQARYAVFFKNQMQYQLVMVFLTDDTEIYFNRMLKNFKIK